MEDVSIESSYLGKGWFAQPAFNTATMYIICTEYSPNIEMSCAQVISPGSGYC